MFIENIIQQCDTVLRTLFPPEVRRAKRETPGHHEILPTLTSTEKQHIAGCMRVNHSGEVCAQALYQGQAFTARSIEIKMQMAECAEEEVDHLAWCESRLHELDAKRSLLNPIWYVGSFCIGAIAGLIHDRFSLGFIVETENQVAQHLESHIASIPAKDTKTIAILEQMLEDEKQHAHRAQEHGAFTLPAPIQILMRYTAKVMTTLAYYI